MHADENTGDKTLTFRDILTVQQTGVSVNVILWGQKKKKKQKKTKKKKTKKKRSQDRERLLVLD